MEENILSRFFVSTGITPRASSASPSSWRGGTQFPGQIKQVKGAAFPHPTNASPPPKTKSPGTAPQLRKSDTSSIPHQMEEPSLTESSADTGKRRGAMPRSRSDSDLKMRASAPEEGASFRIKKFQALLEQSTVDIGMTFLIYRDVMCNSCRGAQKAELVGDTQGVQERCLEAAFGGFWPLCL